MRLLFPSLLLFFVPCVLGALNNQGRSNKTDALPETAKNVDMHKMMGTWFEMFAHYRNISENCVLYRFDRLYQTHQAVVFSTRKMYRNGFVRDQKLISGPVVSFSSGTVAGFRNTSKLMSLSDRKPFFIYTVGPVVTRNGRPQYDYAIVADAQQDNIVMLHRLTSAQQTKKEALLEANKFTKFHDGQKKNMPVGTAVYDCPDYGAADYEIFYES